MYPDCHEHPNRDRPHAGAYTANEVVAFHLYTAPIAQLSSFYPFLLSFKEKKEELQDGPSKLQKSTKKGIKNKYKIHNHMSQPGLTRQT
jgi:hypothetical protein